MRAALGLGCLIVFALLAAQPAAADTITFDSPSTVSTNFDVDVIGGDSNTHWRAGYGPSGSYSGSDGGFAHFNAFSSSNSLQFKDGPVFLNSFDMSSQYFSGGAGVAQGNAAENDVRLVLYDASLNVLLDTTLYAASDGDWVTYNFDVANVSIIWMAPRGGDGTGTGGWWPNIDNIRFNEPSAVPEPASVTLLGLSLMGLAAHGRRRRRRFAER